MPYRFDEDLRAGDLDQRVTIETPDYNDRGDEIEGHTNPVTVWASVEPLRGLEAVEAARETSQVDTRIRIRYRTGMDTAKRVTHGAVKYDVRSVRDVNGARKTLELMCRMVS